MNFRHATLEELETILGWAAEEGWNPGWDDAAGFFAADPEGFFVAEIGGALAAAISVVNHTKDFAFLGLYICRPEFRGRGIGNALWNHAIEHAGDRTIGLDGVPDQQDNYRKSGFVLTGQTRRFEGEIDGVPDPRARVAAVGDIPGLSWREATRTGVAKDAFNAVWLAPTKTRRTWVLEGTSAFLTARACRVGTKIGPMLAETLDDAVALIRHAVSETGGPHFIDVPEGEEALAAWCEGQGMVVSFGTARMYRGAPPFEGAGVLAVSTLELG
ncbi:MAG: GNAT family N-acetyltransferase [Paracoccaceae bacterium]|nr:GNAT family N-acetyltransferase [Paracoccaceae bacterium]